MLQISTNLKCKKIIKLTALKKHDNNLNSIDRLDYKCQTH